MPGVFNPWRDKDDLIDIGQRAPKIRAANLVSYLEHRRRSARLILIGEAPGYRGCHVCGIPFTSERMLLGYMPDVDHEAVFPGTKSRATRPDAPLGGNAGRQELSASIVWRMLLGAGLNARAFVLWNAFPFHPHKPHSMHTNRKPTSAELEATCDVLPEVRALFPRRVRVVAVGRVAERALRKLGIEAPAVRHPAQGGAKKFREQVVALL